MNAYQPLDLSKSYNAGPDVLPAGLEVCTGSVAMRGLPFQIGGGDGNCFVALDGAAASVTIPVGGFAKQIIFAHTLLETAVPLGGKLGIAVADYVFNLSGGREERVGGIRPPPDGTREVDCLLYMARSRAMFTARTKNSYD